MCYLLCGEVETNKQTFTADKNNHVLLSARIRRVLLILKAHMFLA